MTRITSKLTAQGPDLAALAAAAAPAPEPQLAERFMVIDPSAPLAGADVLDCPASLLGAMPTATTLGCVTADGRGFEVTTSRARHAAALEAGLPVFTGAELAAIAFGAMHGRVTAVQLGEWLDTKLRAPNSRVTPADAIGAAVVPETSERWTIGRAFERLGVRLQAVHLED